MVSGKQNNMRKSLKLFAVLPLFTAVLAGCPGFNPTSFLISFGDQNQLSRFVSISTEGLENLEGYSYTIDLVDDNGAHNVINEALTGSIIEMDFSLVDYKSLFSWKSDNTVDVKASLLKEGEKDALVSVSATIKNPFTLTLNKEERSANYSISVDNTLMSQDNIGSYSYRLEYKNPESGEVSALVQYQPLSMDGVQDAYDLTGCQTGTISLSLYNGESSNLLIDSKQFDYEQVMYANFALVEESSFSYGYSLTLLIGNATVEDLYDIPARSRYRNLYYLKITLSQDDGEVKTEEQDVSSLSGEYSIGNRDWTLGTIIMKVVHADTGEEIPHIGENTFRYTRTA